MSENPRVSEIAPFAEVARDPGVRLDELALALAGEFRDVDAVGAIASLDALGAALSRAVEQTSRTPDAVVDACRQVLGGADGFRGDQVRYDHPDNSMLDLVVTRRRGLPILLSVVYVEVARRAGIEFAGVGLPGHFVVGHFGVNPPVLLDPFAGGETVTIAADRETLIRPWGVHEIAMRMLNNLVAAYERRGDLTMALRAATMRLTLPVQPGLHDTLKAELRAIQAQLN
jgi:regulator of sirC expression with transglutaminase-like and TPR domain